MCDAPLHSRSRHQASLKLQAYLTVVQHGMSTVAVRLHTYTLPMYEDELYPSRPTRHLIV
jgi:hypothetical protein